MNDGDDRQDDTQLARYSVKELVRMAYEGNPEIAGDIARLKGEYSEFLNHMKEVHKRLVYPFLTTEQKQRRLRWRF